MQETCVQSLDGEDPLEKGMETHTSILAWRIPRTEKPDGPQSMGFKESDMTNTFIFKPCGVNFIITRGQSILNQYTLFWMDPW